ncbi:hypothetical protein [Helicobacter sp. 23-1045]
MDCHDFANAKSHNDGQQRTTSSLRGSLSEAKTTKQSINFAN